MNSDNCCIVSVGEIAKDALHDSNCKTPYMLAVLIQMLKLLLDNCLAFNRTAMFYGGAGFWFM